MSWGNVVQTVGKWYQANIHDYSQRTYSICNLPNAGNVRHDCSGFVSACLRVAGIIAPVSIYSSSCFLANGAAAPWLRKAGFVSMPYNLAIVQPFDIIAYNGHTEIYAGLVDGHTHLSWSWGSCHDGRNGNSGMPTYTNEKSRYVIIWRQGGNAAALASNMPFNPATYMYGGTDSASSQQVNTYDTFTSDINPAVFTSAMKNSFSITTTKMVAADSSDGHRTRIYRALAPTIKIDELSMPIDKGKLEEDPNASSETKANEKTNTKNV